MVRNFIVVLCFVLLEPLGAQDVKTQEQTLQEMMARSIERQKAALRKQLKLKEESSEATWFMMPWPRDLGPRRLGTSGADSSADADPAAALDTPPPPAPVPAKTSALRPGCGPLTGGQLDRYLDWAATNAGIPENLLRAVVHKESRWDPCAVSRKGAQGLMQLTPLTARWLGVTKPFDAAQSLWGGAQYLRYPHDRFGSWKLALSAYNAGPGNVDSYGGMPPFDETERYVADVLRTRNMRLTPPPAPIAPPAIPLASATLSAPPTRATAPPPEKPEDTVGRVVTGMIDMLGSAAQRTVAPFTEPPRPRVANADSADPPSETTATGGGK